MKNGPANASWPEIKCVLLSFSSLGHILTEEEKIELPMPKTKFNLHILEILTRWKVLGFSPSSS